MNRKRWLTSSPFIDPRACDEQSQPLFGVTRHVSKTFRQWHPNGCGGWKSGMAGVRRVPYQLPEVLEAPIVFIAEGEKDVETLREWGFCATCNPGGAEKWPADFSQYLRGRTGIMIPDTDPAGRRHMRQVFQNFKPVASQIIVIDLSEGKVKDIGEWFDRGHSEVELLSVIDSCWQTEGVNHG